MTDIAKSEPTVAERTRGPWKFWGTTLWGVVIAAAWIICGALATADHALLTPMVARHIAKHGGDAARSLAALSSPPPVKQALAAVVDEDVQASLVHLPQQAQQREVVPPTMEGEPPVNLGPRYLIERAHAKGGSVRCSSPATRS